MDRDLTIPKTLSFVVPIYNEEECIPELIRRFDPIVKAFAKDWNVSAKVIFVDDGSKDSSFAQLKDLSAGYAWMLLLKLSRNFGHQIAVTAGLDAADSDYVCIIDADLQDPPELVFDMLKIMETGVNIVYGKRRSRQGETRLKRTTASVFYRTLRFLTEVDIPPDTGDFRLIDSKVLRALKQMPEHNRFLRGMVPWVGFKSVAFEYHRDSRFAGTTKYPLRKMLRLGLDAVLSFSAKPMRIASYLGVLMVLASFAGLFAMLYLWTFTSVVIPGLMVGLSATVLMNGVTLVIVGIMGEYISRIYVEVQRRPLYLVDSVYEIRPEKELQK